ncbi:MAG: hypothetical protein V3T83_18350, partial [Acidobacteriota bacterium]
MKHRSTESSSVVAIGFFLRVWSLNTARPGRARFVAHHPLGGGPAVASLLERGMKGDCPQSCQDDP